MASFNIDIPDNIFEGLGERFDEIAPKMINEALPIYKDAVVDAAKESIHSDPEHVRRQTGDMLRSATVTQAKKNKKEDWVGAVTFAGKDRSGYSNNFKAVELEAGNSKQQARPFLQRAKNKSQSDVVEKMQEVYNREMGQ